MMKRVKHCPNVHEIEVYEAVFFIKSQVENRVRIKFIPVGLTAVHESAETDISPIGIFPWNIKAVL